MKGLSSTALQNTTSFAQPKPPCAAVSSAGALDDLTHERNGVHVYTGLAWSRRSRDEQTSSVVASASGMAAISFLSASVIPFCTSAEKPPMKFTPV